MHFDCARTQGKFARDLLVGLSKSDFAQDFDLPRRQRDLLIAPAFASRAPDPARDAGRKARSSERNTGHAASVSNGR